MFTCRRSSAMALTCALLSAPFCAIDPLQAALLEGHVLRANLVHQDTEQSFETGPTAFATVGPGVEFPGFGFQEGTFPLPALVDIDVTDSTILLTLLIDQPLAHQDVIRFFDENGTIDNIRRVVLDPVTNWNGFTTTRAFGFGEQISIDLSQLSGTAGQQILLDVIPEPAAGTLILGAGLALAAARRRRS